MVVVYCLPDVGFAAAMLNRNDQLKGLLLCMYVYATGNLRTLNIDTIGQLAPTVRLM